MLMDMFWQFVCMVTESEIGLIIKFVNALPEYVNVAPLDLHPM